jgi:hypothetical protein
VAIEVVLGDLGQRRALGDASVRENDVEPTPAVADCREEPVEIVEFRYVGNHRRGADLARSAVKLRRAAAGDEHVRTFGGEARGRGPADASAGSCDECDLSVELTHERLRCIRRAETIASTARRLLC